MITEAGVEEAAVESLTIRVTDLVLDYEIHEDRRAALRQRLVTKSGTGRSLVHALKGVSFDAAEGHSIGVIGSNGSGKSTLLAAVAGLLPPTSGEILVAEEPKLLGVGAMLIPAATGYRNIRLGCMALGMQAGEVDDRIGSIVEFTDIGDAIHRPLRTYSSGMRARLALRRSRRPCNPGSCSSTRRWPWATRRSGPSRRRASKRSLPAPAR